MKKNIALVCGGFSKEFEVSIRSAGLIEKHISPEKYQVYKIVITKEEWYHINAQGEKLMVDKSDFSLPGNIRFDLAFIIIHGRPGENGMLQGYFDMLSIPYTGCNSYASSVTFNKSLCNAVAGFHGIKVSPSLRIDRRHPYSLEEIKTKIGFPCFVKPNAEGSSIGISKVKKAEDLETAIQKAFAEDQEVMIEKFVKGIEVSCGLMEVDSEIKVFPLTQIIAANEFFDYESKYSGKSQEIVPAPIDARLGDRIGETAKKIYRMFNCFGVIRCDFIIEDGTQEIFFLEANTTPGQSEQSIVPQQILHMGWTLEQFYSTQIEAALQRGQN